MTKTTREKRREEKKREEKKRKDSGSFGCAAFRGLGIVMKELRFGRERTPFL